MMIVTGKDARAKTLLPIIMLTTGINYVQNPLYRPDGAEYHHIFFIEKGNGVLKTSDGSFPLTEGTAVFMRKGIPMGYYGTGKVFETAWITFNGEGVDGILEYFGAENFEFLKSKSIYLMIANAYRLAERSTPPEILSKCAYDILTAFFYELRSAQKPPALIRAKKYIEEHYGESLSVPDVARELGISESLLFRLFREIERQTPSDYLKNVRIRHAEQLLLSEPKMKIRDLAAACGFFDAAYFCKVFKAQTGMTPKNYRSKFIQ